MKQKNILLLLPIFISSILLCAQSKDQNYIHARTMTNAAGTEYITVIDYYDGLGRHTQTIRPLHTPEGNDLVQWLTYDAAGRESKQYLPYPKKNGIAGAFVPLANALPEQQTFYDDEGQYAFIENIYESSPLNRVIAIQGQGKAWQDKPVKTDYQTNTSPVNSWRMNNNNGFTAFAYAANQLYVTHTTDENGNVSRTYKDKQDRLVMTEAHDGSQWLQTRYVYDDFGLVRTVLPPEAKSPDDENLCFYYNYDERHRAVETKMPGADWIYAIYDKRDRLVMTQDGNQREANRWMLYTYDDFNREIRREVVQLQNKWSRESMRWLYENGEPPYTERMVMGETQYDTASPDILTPDPSPEGEGRLSFVANEVATATLLATSNKGRIIMTKTRILTASPQPPPKEGEHAFLSTAFYYDNYGRIIQTVANNAMGGIDRTSNSYDFTGNVMVSKQVSTWAGDGDPGTVTLTTVFGYDALKRPTTVRLQVNEAEPVTISALEYDELLHLKTKKLHNNKEIIDYAYNIRDWITEVNSNLFSYTLTYDKPLGEVAPQYNGNISAMRVRTARQAQQAYAFEYDAINRLTASHFYDNSWSNNYTEQLTYDKNGNITALQRYRHLPEPIDNLVYLYNGNQVATITDNGTPDGYPVGITHYAYDANGNNTFEGTRTRIAYNEINLPRQVQLLGGRGIKNVYAADGRKLKSEAKQGSEYIKEGTKTYSGNLVFDINDELDYIIFPEGRILYDVDDSTFSFEYHLKDHLGSVRVAFVPTTGGTEVVQENSYYPFGAPIADLSWSPKSTNRYGYNGKEHIKEFELDWVDLGHRIYNPLRAQFSTSDRFAEKYYSLSNYSFAAGNPIKIIDMNGDSTVLAGWNNSVGSFNQNFHNGVMDRVENPMLLLNDLNNMAGGILQLLADFTGISDLFGTNQTAAAIDNAISEVSNIPNMSAEEVGSMLAGVSIFAIETAATRKIPLGEIRAIRNVGLAGKVHPKTGVPFDKAGFPDFSNHLYKGGINEVKIAPTGNRLTDAIEANKVAGYGFTPKGYTWHHHQSIGKMQLVETKIHSQTGHTGGFELWKY